MSSTKSASQKTFGSLFLVRFNTIELLRKGKSDVSFINLNVSMAYSVKHFSSNYWLCSATLIYYVMMIRSCTLFIALDLTLQRSSLNWKWCRSKIKNFVILIE